MLGTCGGFFEAEVYVKIYISYRLKNVKGIDELPAIIDFKKEGSYAYSPGDLRG